MRGDDLLPARRHSLGPVITYEIEKQHFDHIEDAATSIGTPLSATFALIPVAITLNVTLVTTVIKNAHVELALWGAMFTFYVVGVLCAIVAYMKRGQLKRYMKEIRESQVAPVASKEASASPDLTAVSDPDVSTMVDASIEEENDA